MNFESFKGRTIRPNQRVAVYRNLHKSGTVYSILDPSTGLVLGYSPAVLLKNATLKVSEAGRQRVLKTRKKNVHAFVEGQLADPETLNFIDYMMMDKVSYNPYKTSTFVRDTDIPVNSAKLALINENGVSTLQAN